MKATIEIVQAAPIPAHVSERAVDLAAHMAMFAACQSVVKAARDAAKAALLSDEAYAAAVKDEKKMRRDDKKRNAARIEDNKAVKAERTLAVVSEDIRKTIEKAVEDSGKSKKAISRKIADSGQMMLPYYVEDGK